MTISLLSTLATAGSSTVRADIHTMGIVCQPLNVPATSLTWDGQGIKNLATAAQQVSCAIPRPDVPAGAAATFIIEGTTPGGLASNCFLEVQTISSLRFIQNFSLAGTSSRIAISVPPGSIVNTDHVWVTCSLAPRPTNGTTGPGGTIFGFTAVGP